MHGNWCLSSTAAAAGWRLLVRDTPVGGHVWKYVEAEALLGTYPLRPLRVGKWPGTSSGPTEAGVRQMQHQLAPTHKKESFIQYINHLLLVLLSPRQRGQACGLTVPTSLLPTPAVTSGVATPATEPLCGQTLGLNPHFLTA